VFLTELQEETSAELSAALAERDQLRAEYYARSAINLSRLLIASEPTIRKSVSFIGMALGMKTLPQLPVWQYTDMVLGPFNDKTGVESFSALAGVDTSAGKNLGIAGGGRFEVTVVDEDSKIDVNTGAHGDPIREGRLGAQLLGLMAPPQYNPLFEGRDADDQFSDRAVRCGAIIDWTDSDENLYACDPTATGATAVGGEDSFYQLIGMPYRRKNAAFDSLDELRLVRGMDDDFWATFVDPEPNDPQKRLVTVWGQGKINVNTANAQTLMSLICGNAVVGTEMCTDPVQTENFLMVLTMVKGASMGLPLFRSPKNFLSILEGKGSSLIKQALDGFQIKPVVFKSRGDTEKQIAVDSKLLSIYAEGVVPGLKKETRVRIHTVVDIRGAPPIGDPFSGLPGGTGAQGGAGAGASAAAGGSTGQQGKNEAPSAQTPEAIAATLAQNPAGTVVYWRVE
jgi:general secretion pathway protein K